MKFKVTLLLAKSKQLFDKKTNKTYYKEEEFRDTFEVTASDLDSAKDIVTSYINSLEKEEKATVRAVTKTIKQI